MKKLPMLLLMSLISISVNASITFASSFGYNPTDATTAFRNAVYSEFDTVIVDLQSSDWKVKPNAFFDLENKTIIFEPGVILIGLPNEFNPIYSTLVRLVNCNNIDFVGYQAEFKMSRSEYVELDDSEYRHSLTLFNCNNISVRGLTIRESGGDGIYIGGENGGGAQGYSKDILIEDVRCIDHYRQGLSVASAENLTVKNCLFKGTEGTLPEAGVDIEPFETYQRVVNVVFENCSFVDNGWSGMALALFDMDSTSIPVSIIISDCYFKDNGRPGNTYALSEIHASADDLSPVQGNVLIERCFVDGSDYGAFYSRKTADAYNIEFSNCVFKDVSRLQLEFNEPIFLEVPDYDVPSDALGGIAFNDVFISYETDFNFFRVYGWSTLEGLQDISGSFTILEPNNNGILYSNVSDTINVDFTYENFEILPQTFIDGNVLSTEAIECDSTLALFALSRTSQKVDYPLGITLSNSGTATYGDDLNLQPEGAVIPAGETLIVNEILARNDQISELSETAEFTIENSNLYQVSSGEQLIVELFDCAEPEKISELDANGNLLVDGEYFLPIGFYCEGLFFDDYPDIPNVMDSAGFNTVYTESTIGELIDYEPFLDNCEALGLKNILGLPYFFMDPEDFSFYINEFKNHPSVIAWNILDDANNFTLSEIQTQKQKLLLLDESRVSSASWYNDLPPFPEMVPSIELVGMQAYPWEDSSFNDLVFVDALWRSTVVEAEINNKFAFATPQAFNWGVETYPPPEHLDCQTYLGLITGMKGILFYTYKDYDIDSTIDITQPEIFEAASRIANEILETEWKEVILFGEHEYVNIDYYRYYATWEHNGYLYLIAVNGNDELTYEYTIVLPDNVVGEALNFFPYRENPFIIDDGNLVGELEPYQVAIYRMETTATSNVLLNFSVNSDDLCTAENATVNLYAPNSLDLVESIQSSVNELGTMNVPLQNPGIYDVFIHIDGFLQKAFPNTSLLESDTLIIGNLKKGDFNNSNGINIVDFTLFGSSFGSAIEDENYESLYDMNCSGGINIVDYTLLGINFGLSGDAPPAE